MSRRASSSTVGLALAVAVACSARAATAETAPATPAEDLLFVRGGSVLRAPTSGKGAAVEVAALPAALGTVTGMEVSPNGLTLLLHGTDGAHPHWVRLGEGALSEAKSAACRGRASMSPNGRCLVCPAGEQSTVILRLDNGRTRTLALASGQVAFLGPAGRELIAVGEASVCAQSLRRPAKKRLLAPHRPEHGLLASPDGQRAVGVYAQGKVKTLEIFRLDGKAARRTLLRDAEPIAWSADSRWLLVQQGKKACIASALGGQYKCWRRYQASAIAADGSYAILARPAERNYALYRAELTGARARRPKLIADRVSAPAAAILASSKN